MSRILLPRLIENGNTLKMAQKSGVFDRNWRNMCHKINFTTIIRYEINL